ncbi:hypothetical protein Y717_10825 [Streptomyces scopuliridis RB72]|uniref:Uncharacterized protein n=1 Tax=Streptomyces scopuliridis RB72 TaxID=1440053 RepID=A0A2T7SP65_9ACTN|nr:hypothetical protein Y717_10825 [Streptomyces scopuliridis RB72]
MFFAGCALLALLGLCAIALDDVPTISGTVALLLTAAAIVAALFH